MSKDLKKVSENNLERRYISRMEESFCEVIDEIDLHLNSLMKSEIDDFDQLFNDFNDIELLD